MLINTEIHGEIEYQEDDVFIFTDGLYGFKNRTRFIIIDINEPELPFQWLQSLDDGNLSFVLTNPFLFHEDYDFVLPETVSESLRIESLDQLMICSLVVVQDELSMSTINLKAPLIINKSNHWGRQVILNEDYPYKYFIFNKQEG